MDSTYQIISYNASELPDAYRPLIYSKWLRSLRFGNDYFRLMEQSSYFLAYHKFIEKILSQPGCHVKLAVLAEDRDVVLGFAVVRNYKLRHVTDILDYMHVHKDYRRTGIGTSLIGTEIDTVTHLTRQGMSFWNNVLPEAKFNPFV